MPFEFKADKKSKKVFEDFAKGKPAGMTFINSYQDGVPAELTKIMTPLTSILKNEYGYSIKVVLDSKTADELNKYDALAQRQVPNGFTYKKLLYDDDKMYLKLKTKDDAFVALDFATPTNFEEVTLEAKNLEVTFKIGIWVNFEKQTAGTFLQTSSITIA